MKNIPLLLIVLTAVFSLVACDDEITEPAVLSADGQATIITKLTVWGMSCQSCVDNVVEVLSDLDGVIDVSVSLNDEIVTVVHELELDVDMLKKTITSQGFNIP